MRGAASEASKRALAHVAQQARRARARRRLPADKQPTAFLVAVGLEDAEKAVSPTPVEGDDEEDEEEG